MKESKKIDKYVDLARKEKMWWNMYVTVIIGALNRVTKRLGKNSRGTVNFDINA